MKNNKKAFNLDSYRRRGWNNGISGRVPDCNHKSDCARHVPEGSRAGPIAVSDEGGHDSKAAAACQSTRWRQGLSREVQRKSVLRLSDREEGKDLRGEPGAVQCV